MFTTWLRQTPDSCWCQEACAFKMLYLNCEAGEIVKLFLDCELMCPDSINLQLHIDYNYVHGREMNSLLDTSSEEDTPNWQLIGFRATLEGL